MTLTKMISRVLLAGTLTGLPAATALAEDYVMGTCADCPGGEQAAGLEQAQNTIAHAQLADEYQAKADRYDQRAEQARAWGAASWKTGEVQRNDRSATEYRAKAAEQRVLAGEAPAQCAPATP
jgi:hypothetical protein